LTDYVVTLYENKPLMTENSTYQVVVKTENRAGLWSNPAVTGAITVDLTPPTITFTSGLDEIVYNTDTADFNVPYRINETVSASVTAEFFLLKDEGYVHVTLPEDITPGAEETYTYTDVDSGHGTYELYAKLTDQAGHIVERTQSQMIRVNMPHIIDFNTEPFDYFLTNPNKPLMLSATIIDNDGDDAGIMTYSWDLDNDAIEDSADITPLTHFLHEQIENKETNYVISLTVTDRNNLSVTSTAIVKVVNTTQGALYTDEYWSGTHILTGPVEIPEGITLTTNQYTNVHVQYNPDPAIGYDYGILVYGTLNAQEGTHFRIPDAVEDRWKGIDIQGTANLNTVTIQDAERAITVIPGSSATIDRCTLINNTAGIHIYKAIQEITNTTFINNLYGIKEEKGATATLTSCHFNNNIIDYYHQDLTRLTMEELNALGTNSNNTREGE
jgi:hypothetical protein